MLLLLDNYDSFTYNLYQYLSELGADVLVRRNDELTVEEAERLGPSHIVISPGPCTPREAGISNALIERLGPHIPLLGVCLGHQCIGAVFGGQVIRAPEPVHGKTSFIRHNGRDIFTGLPNPFEAIRYHSLVVARDTLPDAFAITATVATGEDAPATTTAASAGHPPSPRRARRGAGGEVPLIMGLRHRVHPIYGVQFHPESILTNAGKDLLRNFLSMTASRPAPLMASASAPA